MTDSEVIERIGPRPPLKRDRSNVRELTAWERKRAQLDPYNKQIPSRKKAS